MSDLGEAKQCQNVERIAYLGIPWNWMSKKKTFQSHTFLIVRKEWVNLLQSKDVQLLENTWVIITYGAESCHNPVITLGTP